MLIPDTKLTGDIAEQATILQALKKGWNILKPKSADYRNAWELIQKWATLSETPA